MNIIQPVTVTESILIDPNVPENDAPAWTAGATFVKGNQVVDAHHIWQWAGDANTNTTVKPSADTSSPQKWVDLGATNRYRMFDKEAGGAFVLEGNTANAGSIEFSIKPGQVVNAIALFGLSATSVEIIMTDPTDGEVYKKDIPLSDVNVMTYYDYFFAPISRKTSLVKLDLPSYGTATVTVRIKNANSIAKCAYFVIGRYLAIGDTVYGTSLGIRSYSDLSEDTFGRLKLTRRGKRKVVNYDVRVPTDNVDKTYRILEQLFDVVAVFIGTTSMEVTTSVGIYEDMRKVLDNKGLSQLTLQVRSLV